MKLGDIWHTRDGKPPQVPIDLDAYWIWLHVPHAMILLSGLDILKHNLKAAAYGATERRA